MILLLGCSASGKSTIEKELEKKGFKKIVSYTTRPPRNGELDGIDYHYVSKDHFLDLLDDNIFVEHTVYNGWYYGIAKEDCLDSSVVIVEPNGYRQLLKVPHLNILSFYINTPERERLKRMVDRGDNLLEVFRRIFSDQGVFQSMENEVDYVIDNVGSLDESVSQILKMILENK